MHNNASHLVLPSVTRESAGIRLVHGSARMHQHSTTNLGIGYSEKGCNVKLNRPYSARKGD